MNLSEALCDHRVSDAVRVFFPNGVQPSQYGIFLSVIEQLTRIAKELDLVLYRIEDLERRCGLAPKQSEPPTTAEPPEAIPAETPKTPEPPAKSLNALMFGLPTPPNIHKTRVFDGEPASSDSVTDSLGYTLWTLKDTSRRLYTKFESQLKNAIHHKFSKDVGEPVFTISAWHAERCDLIAITFSEIRTVLCLRSDVILRQERYTAYISSGGPAEEKYKCRLSLWQRVWGPADTRLAIELALKD